MAITPAAMKVINNPIASFATTFGSILLSTHMKNRKEEAAGGVKAMQENIRSQKEREKEKEEEEEEELPRSSYGAVRSKKPLRKWPPTSHARRKSMVDSIEPPTQPLGSLRTHMEHIAPMVGNISKLMMSE
jgi:hypothetical protein